MTTRNIPSDEEVRVDAMRAGISRVVVEVIILVIGVALALLIFSPVGSYIFGALGRASAVGGQTTISVLAVSGLGTGTIEIYVKNLGPNELDLGGNTSAWQVFFDSQAETVDKLEEQRTPADGKLSVDEVVVLIISKPFNGSYSNTSSYSIIVYGPGGTQTEYLFRGG